MSPTLALLPLDDRPVNYDYPRYLARMAGHTLHLPPREWLGNPWQESQHGRLVNWLVQEGEQAGALIVALDTLAYGGLIPSRTSRQPLDQVLEHLAVLKHIKVRRPDLLILASSVIQRVSRDNSSEEEKDYWALYGSAMFRLSYLEHKTALGEASQEESAESARLRGQIPAEIYDDYRQGRRRNHAVNQAMLDWLAEGIFDYLLLPQDDTAAYGWNIAEARLLQRRIRQENLSARAITYPGADEIGCLLLAGYLCHQAGFQPRVWPRYSSIHSPAVVTAYEDRPVHELLKAHLAPLGGTLAASPQEADLTLYINAPIQEQGEAWYQWLAWRGLDPLHQELPQGMHAFLAEAASTPAFQNTRREMESPQRSPEEFVRALAEDLAAGRLVALADVAFVNGADLTLGNLLVQQPDLVQLCAYAGWNTAGNTLGTVLAQAVLRIMALRSGPHLQQNQAHLEFLYLRFLDDYAYQARERTLMMLEDLPELGLPPSWGRLPSGMVAAVEARLRSRLAVAGAGLEQAFVQAGGVQHVQLHHIHLPWQRVFEMGCEVQVTLP
jgi:hypothetical protein